jgi:riboflavin biosynthesis pyrimidine reductase
MPPRSVIAPLQTLLPTTRGRRIALPAGLSRLVGSWRMIDAGPAPRVFSNFVTTLDGVVSLNVKGHDGGGDISGFSAQDRMMMGLLRATADAVVLGGGSLAADATRLWTPQAICPELDADYRVLVKSLWAGRPALRVVVSASGRLDLRSAAFRTGQSPLLVVTRPAGARQLALQKMPSHIEVRAVGRSQGPLAATDILEALAHVATPARVLVEGGPRLLAGFYAERLLDEQFLTLSPQVAGRQSDDGRIGLAMGRHFAPKAPRWSTLLELRRGANHLFLRYLFERGAEGAPKATRPRRASVRI